MVNNENISVKDGVMRMKQIQLGKSNLNVPAIAVGCMRFLDLEGEKRESFVRKALDLGLNFFEHADIYGRTECESEFGKIIGGNASLREQMIIQSKCGIVPGKMYDLSKEHILSSVDGILKRLQTEYLDLLVLHRPDALVEPEEVAEAFEELEEKGKVRHFGVSNHKPLQIELLKTCVKQELQVNQLQFSIPASSMICAGLEANMTTDGALDRDGSVLDYSRIHGMTIQAWSPFQVPGWRGVFIGHEEYEELDKKLEELANKYQVSKTTIATAWILRHPAKMQVVAGTTKISRLEEMIAASSTILSKEEWYGLYMAAGNILP